MPNFQKTSVQNVESTQSIHAIITAWCRGISKSRVQWRDNDQWLYIPQEHAGSLPKSEYYATKELSPSSPESRYNDPVTRYELSKRLMRPRNRSNSSEQETPLSSPQPLTSPNKSGTRNVKPQTYYSFLKSCGVRRARATEEDVVSLEAGKNKGPTTA